MAYLVHFVFIFFKPFKNEFYFKSYLCIVYKHTYMCVCYKQAYPNELLTCRLSSKDKFCFFETRVYFRYLEYNCYLKNISVLKRNIQ